MKRLRDHFEEMFNMKDSHPEHLYRSTKCQRGTQGYSKTKKMEMQRCIDKIQVKNTGQLPS